MSDLITERDGVIMTISLNRPQALNALNRDLFLELRHLVEDIETDPGIAVIVMQGAGGRAFSVGIDLKERQTLSDQEADAFRRQVVFPFYLALHERTKPLVAAVDGYCLGGGFELALAADVIVAAETAQFGLPEVRWGMIPAGGGLQMLTRIIGPLRAKDLALTGRRITAHEAWTMGIVSRLVPAEAAVKTALQTAQAITENVQIAVQGVKRAIDHMVNFREGFGFDIEVSNGCYFSQERKAALDTFGDSSKRS